MRSELQQVVGLWETHPGGEWILENACWTEMTVCSKDPQSKGKGANFEAQLTGKPEEPDELANPNFQIELSCFTLK